MSDPVVEKLKVVSFSYEIWDQEGNMHERVDVPMQYVHGGVSELIEQIEEALAGHRVGDLVEVTMGPEEAFGPHDPALTFTDDLDNVPPQFRHLGAEVEMQNEQGETKSFVVSDIGEDTLTVDGNHPLAGKTVTFKVKVEDIRDATEDEVRNGVPQSPTPLH